MDKNNKNIGIIGAGSWGLALAILLTNNGHKVTMWSHNPIAIKNLSEIHMDSKKLPNVLIPPSVKFTTEIQKAIIDKDFIVLAVPSVHIRTTAKLMLPYISENQVIVNVSKGIEQNSLKLISEQIKEEIPNASVAILSGPSHAEEVSRGLPTTCVIGADNEELAILLQSVFMSDVFRVYISSDITGIELSASLKNVIALAAGIADGLGYGDNTKAALITRGIAEITRLGIRMGGKEDTFSGLAGIGDLIVTCASQHSRNRKAGFLIGQGYSVQDAIEKVGMVVEGMNSAKAALSLAKKYNVSMPIIEQVNAVLFNNKNPKESVQELMLRHNAFN